jgi:hypothetical protein
VGLLYSDHRPRYGAFRVRVEVDDGDGKRRLVVLEVEFEDGFGLDVATTDPKEFGLQRAGAGQWGSCIRIIDPVTVRFCQTLTPEVFPPGESGS